MTAPEAAGQPIDITPPFAEFTVAAFCEWWIGTVLLVAGEKARPVAYHTAAILAGDPRLQALDAGQRQGPRHAVAVRTGGE
jgi:hypothetical protein